MIETLNHKMLGVLTLNPEAPYNIKCWIRGGPFLKPKIR
jgi:hypothetical protein